MIPASSDGLRNSAGPAPLSRHAPRTPSQQERSKAYGEEPHQRNADPCVADPRHEQEALMPQSPPSRCGEPGCGRLVSGGNRCEDHRRKPWANPSANTRELSGRQRERIHKRQIRDEPQCRNCGSAQDLQTDHVIEVSDGGSLLDASNLQTLCGTCHAAKTRAHRAHRASQRGSRSRG